MVSFFILRSQIRSPEADDGGVATQRACHRGNAPRSSTDMSRYDLLDLIVGFVTCVVRAINLSSNARITFGIIILNYTLDLTRSTVSRRSISAEFLSKSSLLTSDRKLSQTAFGSQLDPRVCLHA
jgi:hypothetical protein